MIVSGTLGGKAIRYSSKVSLKDAEQGNSFIPRLWARMHLDALLQQGASPAIKDEIIALSEEYHIITPYTSLLVLESDADRERFKVKRGFQMRDGEKFFAEGRDNANYELVQQQMKLAGNWRIGLRSAVLGQLAALGRRTPQLQCPGRHRAEWLGLEAEADLEGMSGSYSWNCKWPHAGFQSCISGLLNFQWRNTGCLNGTELEEPFGTPEGMDKYLADYEF